MPIDFTYPLLPDAGGGSGPQTPTTSSPYGERSARAFLGFGVTRPFRRDLTGDIVAEDDVALVKACVAQVIGTRASNDAGTMQGELPWRPRFGSLLHTLRFRNIDPLARKFAQLYVSEALARWEPRVVVKRVLLRDGDAGGLVGNVLEVHLLYDVLTNNIEANQVLVADVVQVVPIYREAA